MTPESFLRELAARRTTAAACMTAGAVERLVLDGLPPSVHQQYSGGFRGKKHQRALSPAYAAFRDRVAVECVMQRFLLWAKLRPAPVFFAVTLHSPRWRHEKSGKLRRLDADNKLKPLLDAVQRATGLPDENVVGCLLLKSPVLPGDPKTERVVVEAFRPPVGWW